MKTEITKIKLQLKDLAIELTATEAREVQKELNKLFEMEKTELQKIKEQFEKDATKTIPMPYLVPVYPAPIIIERNVPYWPRPWEVWCTEDSGTTLCMSVYQVS